MGPKDIPCDGGDISLKVLFLHGLEGNPDGTKASYLRQKYDTRIPMLDTLKLRKLKDQYAEFAWPEIPRDKIIKAATKPLEQAQKAIKEYHPDIIVGSSLGGAILAMLVRDDIWNGPTLFLASGAQLLFGVTDLMNRASASRHWIHGMCDSIVPYTHSLNAAQESYGTCQLIDDDHRLESIIDSGILAEAIENLTKNHA